LRRLINGLVIIVIALFLYDIAMGVPRIRVTGGGGGMTSFIAEDGDGTEVSVSDAEEWKFVEGVGIDINWTDTDPGSDADPFDLTISCDIEGTEIASTGESGASKYLREDGDGTCSWQTPAGSGDFLADGTVSMTGNFNINTQAMEDANSNELVTFITAASAVNNIQVTNAATGDGVKLTAVGGDTNIDLHLEPKGIGIIRLEEVLPATAGQSLSEMMFDVDSSAQVSTSEFHAILVETTGTPAGEVAAVGTVGKVDPIHQHVATFATPSQTEFAGEKHTGGTVWVDGIDASEIFVADDDEIYVGSATQFDEIEVIMGTAATKNVIPTFWYNTAADTWTQFFPDDGTDGFQQSGDIIWLLSGITGLWTGDGDPGGADTTAGYWIKVKRTRVADPGSPTPTTVKIGLATTYSWNNTGAIDVLSMEADTITEGGTGVYNTTESDAAYVALAAATDHSLIRADGAAGQVQGSGIIVGDADVLTSPGNIIIQKDAGLPLFRANAYSDTATHIGKLHLGHAGGSLASPTVTTDGMLLGVLGAGGYDTAMSYNDLIVFLADGAWGTASDDTDEPTTIYLYTVPDGSGVRVLRAVFDAEGNTGIGVDTTPDYFLDVQGALHADGLITGDANAAIKYGATDDAYIDIYEDSDDGTNYTRIQAVAFTTDYTLLLPNETGTAGQVLEIASVASNTMTLEWDDDGGGSAAAELWLYPSGAVLDDNSPPAISVWESTGTGTPRRHVADFDPTTDEILYWSFTWQGYSSADVYWCANDTGANEDAIWACQISATTEADVDSMAEDACDTYNSESEDVNTTEAYRLIKTTITLTNTDSAATDDYVTLRFWRDADDSSGDADADALTSDARLLGVYLY
jgi:hypothetical protein